MFVIIKACYFPFPITVYIHCISKNVLPLAFFNFHTHEGILIFLDRNVTDKVRNH